MRILVADSGSTKTDWAILDLDHPTPLRFTSSGLNPCLMSDGQIVNIFLQEVKEHTSSDIDKIFFYGAGCRPDQVDRMQKLLTSNLSAREASVFSDLVGAAHALCGDSEGIIAILGTGSGSAVYNGHKFVAQTPSLGYILGDEGSGAVLGRRLIGDILKEQLPSTIKQAFFEMYPNLSVTSIIENVYRGEAPNRFLAQFTHFLSAHRNNDAIHNLIVNTLRDFFIRNIRPYARQDLDVNCVGSIAAVFEPELREAAALEKFTIGTILRSPIDRLVEYHRQTC